MHVCLFAPELRSTWCNVVMNCLECSQFFWLIRQS